MEHAVWYNFHISQSRLQYSLAQKHCTKFSNKKSLFFLTVDLYENLHASACTIYAYIYKVKKPATDGSPDL